MDLIMPEMGGYEATQNIRRIEKEYKLNEQERHFICGVSADVHNGIETKCLESGMNKILAKPMSA